MKQGRAAIPGSAVHILQGPPQLLWFVAQSAPFLLSHSLPLALIVARNGGCVSHHLSIEWEGCVVFSRGFFSQLCWECLEGGQLELELGGQILQAPGFMQLPRP